MALYAEILKECDKLDEYITNTKSNLSSDKVKPIFLKDNDAFG